MKTVSSCFPTDALHSFAEREESKAENSGSMFSLSIKLLLSLELNHSCQDTYLVTSVSDDAMIKLDFLLKFRPIA